MHMYQTALRGVRTSPFGSRTQLPYSMVPVLLGAYFKARSKGWPHCELSTQPMQVNSSGDVS